MTKKSNNQERDPAESVADTYNRFPVKFIKGRGTRLWDESGKEYIDLVAGIAVCSLGHCNEAVTWAVQKQMETLVHVSNLYWTVPQIQVASLLTSHSFADKVFFCNSGAESVEAAIKICRRFGHATRGPDCYEVICLEGSFHGRTLATVSATGQPIYQKGFEPLPPGFIHVPPNNSMALKLAAGPRTAAVIMEPIQGEGGVRVLEDDFLMTARQVCDELGALLVFDEVQAGMGRTGTLFAYQQTPVIPDVMCLAKALGNGIPIGATLATREAMSYLSPGSHASTFGGNPIACAAAKVVMETMTADGFLEGVRRKGTLLRNELERLGEKHKGLILEVRGRGLMLAVEFTRPIPQLATQLLEEGFLVLLGQGVILRLVPPLIITEEEIKDFIQTLDRLLMEQD